MDENTSRKMHTLRQLILRKSRPGKFDAIRCQILRLNCIKFDFHCGFAPDPAGGAYSAPPDLLAVFKGHTSMGRDGVEGGKGKRRGEKGKEKGQGREGKEWGMEGKEMRRHLLDQ